jgi:hypothetical protein
MAQPPNIGDAFGVATTRGAGVTLLAGYSDMLPGYELLNVRYLIKPATASDPGPVYQDSFWKVYENPKAFDRAWLVHDVVVEEQQAKAMRRLADPAIDLRRVAVVQQSLDERLSTANENAVAGSAPEEVRFEQYSANSMTLRVRAAGRSLLVLSEMDYPGWAVFVNGTRVPVRRVDGLLRGLVVPSGKSSVMLRYRPVSVYAGGLLSLATVLAFAVVFWLSVRRRGGTAKFYSRWFGRAEGVHDAAEEAGEAHPSLEIPSGELTRGRPLPIRSW